MIASCLCIIGVYPKYPCFACCFVRLVGLYPAAYYLVNICTDFFFLLLPFFFFFLLLLSIRMDAYIHGCIPEHKMACQNGLAWRGDAYYTSMYTMSIVSSLNCWILSFIDALLREGGFMHI